MNIKIASKVSTSKAGQHFIIPIYHGSKKTLEYNSNITGLISSFKKQVSNQLYKNFTADFGKNISFNLKSGHITFMGLGKRKDLTKEALRRNIAGLYKNLVNSEHTNLIIDLDQCIYSDKISVNEVTSVITEAILLSDYQFLKYKTKNKKSSSKKEIQLFSKLVKKADFTKILKFNKNTTSSINYTRDLVNLAPNDLNSITFADMVKEDVEKNLKNMNVKVKILNKKAIEKENMNLLLAVNRASQYEPRFVHLTYTPKNKTKNTKHFSLVGKGITFDTGGASLKPSGAMSGMKFDMGGAATVYGAFRACALNQVDHEVTCLLALTDNALGSRAIVPDTIVKSRNGKTVEILNTDAEGRLILADALDYASDLKPDYIIDAATLTGACLIALGKEVCAVLSNKNDTAKSFLNSASEVNEYAWQLPIVEEYRKDIISTIADIKNIGSGRRAGTPIAASFLEHFIKHNTPWIHLDIAGVCDSQNHLPYCPEVGGSGLMVRSIQHFINK